MAQFANTHDRYDLATNGDNVRETLAEMITNISPMECPVYAHMGKASTQNVKDDWLVDSLEDTDTGNAQIDGDEFAGGAADAADRVANYAQISWKDFTISRRANKVIKAGRKSELAYQEMKKGRALKRDLEAIITNPQAALAGNSTTAPTTATLGAWIGSFPVAGPNKVITNTSRGGSGADPSLDNTNYGIPDTGPTDGTLRALSEADFKTMIANAFTNGGNPDKVFMGVQMKQRFSTYMFGSDARIATPYQDHGSKPRDGLQVAAAVDYYTSDYGVLEIYPDRFQRERDVWMLDCDYWDIAFFDNFKTEVIAKTGDAEKRRILVDWMVKSRQEAASAVVADVDSTTAMVA